jgi:hypothetical protein
MLADQLQKIKPSFNFVGSGIRLEPAVKIERLNNQESALLFDCEKVIGKGLETFIEVGIALNVVRERKLYKHKYTTFAEYCKDRWDMTARRARQICAASDVVANLIDPAILSQAKPVLGSKPKSPPVLPSTESQARPLSCLPAAEQREVWGKAVEKTNGHPTAKAVQEVIDQARWKEEQAARAKARLEKAQTKMNQVLDVAKDTVNHASQARTELKNQHKQSRLDKLLTATEESITSLKLLRSLLDESDTKAQLELRLALGHLEEVQRKFERKAGKR